MLVLRQTCSCIFTKFRLTTYRFSLRKFKRLTVQTLKGVAGSCRLLLRLSPNLQTFKESKNRFHGIDSASLCVAWRAVTSNRLGINSWDPWNGLQIRVLYWNRIKTGSTAQRTCTVTNPLYNNIPLPSSFSQMIHTQSQIGGGEVEGAWASFTV